MKPVFQTKFYPEGNCEDACIASILEINIEDCPNYHGVDWHDVYSDFLIKKGYNFERTFYDDERAQNGYHIATIKSPRGNWFHAVVAKDGIIVHDPYQGADSSNAEVVAWDLLTPLKKKRKVNKKMEDEKEQLYEVHFKYGDVDFVSERYFTEDYISRDTSAVAARGYYRLYFKSENKIEFVPFERVIVELVPVKSDV